VDVAHVTVTLLQHLVDVADVPKQVLLHAGDRLDVAAQSQRDQPDQLLGPLLEVEAHPVVSISQEFLIHLLRLFSPHAQLLFFVLFIALTTI
jgi:hypothetical protein